MNVISGFDGMSCGRLALHLLGHTDINYFAFEIDPYAIKVAQKNFPSTIQLGDIKNAHTYPFGYCDLLLAGSPCQGFSFAGDMLAFDDPRSVLFFEFVKLKKKLEADGRLGKFLLENVPMTEENEKIITDFMEVEPIEINSSLVSAQNRRRLYWTNIEGVTQPEDRKIFLRDILETGDVSKYMHTDDALRYMDREVRGGRTHWDFAHHSDSDDDKSSCLTANMHKGVPYNVLIDRRLYLTEEQIEKAKARYQSKIFESGKRRGNMKFPDSVDAKAKCLTAQNYTTNRTTTHINDGVGIRRLTPIECERLQTLPDNYTAGVSDTQRYKMIGNGWNVETIKHILSFAKL